MENKEMQAAPKKGVIKRIIRTLFSFYPVLMPVVLFCILFNSIVSAIPAVFMQNIIAVIEQSYSERRLGGSCRKNPWNGGNLSNPLCRFPDRILCLLPYVSSDHTGFFEKIA